MLTTMALLARLISCARSLTRHKNLPCASAMSRCLDHREGDRLAGPHQMSDPSPKHCPTLPLNPAHRGRDRVSPKRTARPFYDVGVRWAAIVVPASASTAKMTT